MSTSIRSQYLKKWVEQAAKVYKVDPKVAEAIYLSQWEFVKNSLNKPIPDNLHITNLGKFYRVREYGPRRFSPDGKSNYYKKPIRNSRGVESSTSGEELQSDGSSEKS